MTPAIPSHGAGARPHGQPFTAAPHDRPVRLDDLPRRRDATGVDPWRRSAGPVGSPPAGTAVDGAGTGPDWSGQPGGRAWSAVRLSGNDPRWMDTTAAGQRAVPAQRQPGHDRYAATRHPPDRLDRPGPAGTLTRPHAQDRPEPADDPLEPEPGGLVAALLYTVAWYAVPLLAFVVWLLTLDASAPVGCVTDVTGGGCASARERAVSALLEGAPRFGAALLTSLVVAVGLLRITGDWRAVSVGLASAVVGGGLSTFMVSAITGQPLG